MGRAERFPIRRFVSLDAMKAEEYRTWQGRPAHERLAATADISAQAYRSKDATVEVSRLRRTFVRVERA
jgi:hypothetical protein